MSSETATATTTSSTSTHSYDSYSNEDALALSLATLVSGSLSVFCTLVLWYEIWRARRQRQSQRRRRRKKVASNLYEEFVLQVSVAVLVFTLSLMANPFLLPSQSTGLPWAYGNDLTCKVGGFFFQLFVAVDITCFALSFYFLATVRWGWKDAFIARYWWHIRAVLVLFPLAFATACLWTDSLHPSATKLQLSRLVCQISLPLECQTGDSNDGVSSPACTSHRRASQALIGIQVVSCVALHLASIVSVIMVYRSVVSVNGNNRHRGTRGSGASRRQRKAMIQAVLYTAIYANLVLWFALSMFFPRNFGAVFLFHLMAPLQGSLHLLVYKAYSWCNCLLSSSDAAEESADDYSYEYSPTTLPRTSAHPLPELSLRM